jgi:hypothetical protein
VSENCEVNLPSFDELVRAVLVEGRRNLGNVEFWVDADGPWAGSLSYSLPTNQWVGVGKDLSEAVALLVLAP